MEARNVSSPVFAGITLSSAAFDDHFLFAGPPAHTRPHYDIFLQHCLGMLGNGGGWKRALVMDPNCDRIPLVYDAGATFENGLLKLINPFDARGVRWNISRDITTSRAAKRLANLLLPADGRSRDSSLLRQGIVIATDVICALYTRFPGNWSFEDLLMLLLDGELEMLIDFLDLGNEVGSGRQILLFAEKHPQKWQSLKRVLEPLKAYRELGRLWEKCEGAISITEFLESPYVLLLGSCEGHMSAMRVMNGIIVSCFVDKLLYPGSTNDESTKSFLFLDSGKNVFPIDQFLMLLESKDRHLASVVLAMESAEELQNTFGSTAGKAVLRSLKSKAIFHSCEAELMEWSYFPRDWDHAERSTLAEVIGERVASGEEKIRNGESWRLTSEVDGDIRGVSVLTSGYHVTGVEGVPKLVTFTQPREELVKGFIKADTKSTLLTWNGETVH